MKEMLARRYPDAEFYFMGRSEGMERELVAREGIPFIPVRALGLRRSLSPRNLHAALLAITEPYRLKRIMGELSPSLVLGTGGFVSYPVIKAASLAGVPAILHESNAIPGLAVKLCEGLTARVLLQFESCATHLRYPERAAVIGAPVRGGFQGTEKLWARRSLGISPSSFFILSFGGSLGAEALNAACLSVMQRYGKTEKPLLFIHGCGRRHYDALRTQYPLSSPKTVLLPYINDMPLYMAAADIVIARAGAMTLSEIAACGKASILIPSPYVAEDHQNRNAAYFRERGASLVLEEKALSPERLYEAIEGLRRSPSRLLEMERAAASVFAYDTEALFLAEAENAMRHSV